MKELCSINVASYDRRDPGYILGWLKGVGEGCALSQRFLVIPMMEYKEYKEMLRSKGVHFSGLTVYERQQEPMVIIS